MKQSFLILPCIFVICIRTSLCSAESVWGLDFYTRIDESGASVHQTIVKKHLGETPNLDQYAKGCPKSESLRWLPTSVDALENIERMNYEEFSKALRNNNTSINMDQWQALTICLDGKYRATKERSYKEQAMLEDFSSLWLYSDGDMSNSDYDIVADIEKINMILFSKDLKYSGKIHRKTSDVIADFLSGKNTNAVSSLASEIALPSPEISGSLTESGSSGILPETNLSTLIGGSCRQSYADGIAIDDIVDANLEKELSNLLGSVWGSDTPGVWGYTRPVGSEAPVGDTVSETSKDDFYDTLPCTGVFCVTVNMIPGTQNLLGGGKNYSIEGILDKHTKILSPIADSSLRYEKMTSNFGSAPIQDLKFADIVAGARIYLAKRPNPSKVTPVPTSAESEFEYIRTCALLSAGLSSDKNQSNGLGGAGYTSLSSATTSENIENKNIPLGGQDLKTTGTNCLSREMNAGRTDYYNSFSSDLTQLEAFTQAFLDEIADVMNFGTMLDNKPQK